MPRGAPDGTERLFADGRFPTPGWRGAYFVATTRVRLRMPSSKYPLVLNTGRMRDQWHTMTRTGRVPRLAAHTPEPALCINPGDARNLAIADGQLVTIENEQGRAVARAVLSRDIPPGSVFLPMHWNDRFSADCVPGRLVNADNDPLSGQPELKHTPVCVTPVSRGWEGFLFSRRELAIEGIFYWARHALDGGFAYELAGPENASQMIETLKHLGCQALGETDCSDVVGSGHARRGAFCLAAWLKGVGWVSSFVGPAGTLPAAGLHAVDLL